jgi:hypothetical protein
MPVVTATADGVEVSSSSGTAEELSASLAPPTSDAGEATTGTPAAQPADGAAKEPAPASAALKEPDPASEAGKELAKRRQSMQDRIDQVTWEKHEAKRQADALKAELDALKQPTPKPVGDGRPTLRSFIDRVGTDFDDYEAAVEAHADALTDFKLSARDRASNAAQVTQARDAAVHQAYTRGTAAHADFDAVLGQFLADGGKLAPTSIAEAQGPLGDLESVILGHPHGHSVAYEVAKDADLRGRLLGATSRVMFMAEMGKLLTRLDAAPTGSASPAAPVSKAKPPVKPVVGQPNATSGGPPGDDASDEEHRLYYQQQERARRRA